MASGNDGATVGKSLVIKGYITGVISLSSDSSTTGHRRVTMIIKPKTQPSKHQLTVT